MSGDSHVLLLHDCERADKLVVIDYRLRGAFATARAAVSGAAWMQSISQGRFAGQDDGGSSAIDGGLRR
jgi:hypothetical protein